MFDFIFVIVVQIEGWYVVFRIEENKLVWGHFKEIEIGFINILFAIWGRKSSHGRTI